MIENIVRNNGFDYVDLYLPSGTLWSIMNIGASKPSDPGLYFQWGDTQGYTADQIGYKNGKKAFIWTDCKFGIDRNNLRFSKYATPGETLKLEDDIAHIHMGGSWHIPSLKQFQELIDNTTSEWTSLGGMKGIIFISKKNASKSIFIPAAGFVSLDIISGIGCVCSIWASTLNMNNSDYGQCAYFGPYNIQGSSFTLRCNGYSVRGVIG